jgi:hypothetical protein
VSAHRAELLSLARSLAELAAERTEAQLLGAALHLELRARTHRCPGVLGRIAVHYLLLSEHPQVLAQPGLAQRYRARGWRFADLAEHGAPAVLDLSSLADA